MSGFNVRIPTIKKNSEEKPDAKKAKIEENLEILENFNKLDTNEKFYSLEDKIAINMGHDEIVDTYIKATAEIQQQIMDYIDGKKIEKNIAKLAKLRQLTRLCHVFIAELRKETAANLDIVDAKVLQLQNTTSEVQHIQKEIARCLDFSAGDEDLELVSVEEFYQDAPESISKPETTKTDEHQQYLARLKYEEEQRKEMQSTLQELEGRRNVLVSDIRGKEQRLQSIRPKIEKLIKTSEPIQELLGIKFEDAERESQQKQLALNLPATLTIIHTHAMAYKEIINDKNFDVKIHETDGNSKKVEINEKKSRKEDDHQPIDRKIEEKSDSIFDCHPLFVEFTIDCLENDATVSLFFHHLTELKVVTLKWEIKGNFKSKSVVLNSETFLSELFENDNGEECPNAVGEVQLKHTKKNFEEISKQLGKPYKFVQKLAAVNNELAGIQITEFLRTIVTEVRERVNQRFMLEKFLESLESRNIESLEVGGEAKNVKFVSFKSCEEEKFLASIPESLSKNIEKSTVSERFPFKAEFEDSTKKQKLIAWISIPVNYPNSHPLFGLISSVENKETNVEVVEKKINELDFEGADENLLKKQLSTIIKNFELIFSE